MDIDAQAKHIYGLISFRDYAQPILARCEQIIAEYDAHQALVAEDEADDTPKTEGSGTTDGVEGNTGEPAAGGTTETLPLETVAEDAPKAETETAAVEEHPAETTEEPAAEQAPVVEEQPTEAPAQEEPPVETEEPKPAS